MRSADIHEARAECTPLKSPQTRCAKCDEPYEHPPGQGLSTRLDVQRSSQEVLVVRDAANSSKEPRLSAVRDSQAHAFAAMLNGESTACLVPESAVLGASS